MTTSHGDDAPAAAACKCNNFLDLFDRTRADVELWAREERLSPGEMYVRGGGTKRYGGVEPRELARDGGVHGGCDHRSSAMIRQLGSGHGGGRVFTDNHRGSAAEAHRVRWRGTAEDEKKERMVTSGVEGVWR